MPTSLQSTRERSASARALGLLFVLFVAAFPARLAAQAVPELVTDRPDQTESSALVPVGWVQIETGVDYETSGEARTLGVGSTLVRVGLLENFELRLTGRFASERITVNGDVDERSGFEDASVGAKIGVAREDGAIPEIAFIGHLILPVGGEGFHPESVQPEFRFAVSKSLGESFGLGANIGGAWDGAGTSGAAVYTLTLGADIGELVGAYVEAFGTVRSDAAPVHMFDGGVTLLLAPNVQLDASAGVAASPAAPDWYGAVGFSVRFPR